MKIYKKSITLAKIILGKIIFNFSGLLRRDKRIWVFGSFGIFNDNSKYLYLYCQNINDIKAVWISRNKNSVIAAREFGPSYYYLSVKGMFYTLRAGVYIYSSYLSDINYYTSKGSFKVNLWHGIPLKKIEFDINSYPLFSVFRGANSFRRFIYAVQHVRPDLILSPSEYVSDYSFTNAFRVDKKDIIHARYPRVTELINCSPIVFDTEYNKVFLYAPTWRDDGKDFITESRIDFIFLNEWLLANNSLLLIKLHPSTKVKVYDNSFSNIKLVENQIDPIVLLRTSDCLITDYSSIYFDYLYLNRPIIFFSFDVERYVKNREMYFDYNDVTPGFIANNAKELYECLNAVIINDDLHKIKRTEFFDRFKLKIEGNDVIVSAIKEKVKI